MQPPGTHFLSAPHVVFYRILKIFFFIMKREASYFKISQLIRKILPSRVQRTVKGDVKNESVIPTEKIYNFPKYWKSEAR